MKFVFVKLFLIIIHFFDFPVGNKFCRNKMSSHNFSIKSVTVPRILSESSHLNNQNECCETVYDKITFTLSSTLKGKFIGSTNVQFRLCGDNTVEDLNWIGTKYDPICTSSFDSCAL